MPHDAFETRSEWSPLEGARPSNGSRNELVMAGEFLMGSPESEVGRKWDDGPQHRVRMSRAYYLVV
ncbi:MAG: sulfatase activating formylglycine-generating enzyme [Planctomycetota bacterium]|jgi:formylglycine-generating enzyme required for sulfatase activity